MLNQNNNSKKIILAAVATIILAIPARAYDNEIEQNRFISAYETAVKSEKELNRLQAVKSFQVASDIEPRDFATLTKLGLMHLYSDSSGEIKDKSVAKSIVYLTKANSIKPGDSMVALLLGRAYQSIGETEKAIKFLSKSANLEPDNALLNTSLGSLYFEQKEFKKTIEIFSKIVLVYPDNLKARGYLGAALQATENYLAAIEQYNYVLGYQPDNYSMHKNLGDCWLALKQFDKARENYEFAREVDPMVPHIYADIAFVARTEANYDLAIESYRKAIELKDNHDWKKALAYTLWTNNQVEEAIEVFDEIGEYSVSGYLYQSLGKFDEAIVSYNKAIELDPKDHKTRFNLARLYHDSLEFDLAKEGYQKVLEQKPDDVETLFYLAVLEHEQGNIEIATKYYIGLLTEQLSVAANLPAQGKLIKNNVHYNLAVAYKATNEFEKAESNFEKLLDEETQQAGFDKTKDVLKELSFIKIALGKDEEAEKIINDWLRKDPANVEARNLYADFLVHVSKERKAVDQLRLASVLDQTIESRLKLANLLHAQNNLYEALAEYQMILQANPENLNALLGAANNFKALGFKDEAINIYKKASESHPEDVLANYNYGLLLQESNELAIAIKHYEKVLAINPNFLQTYYVLGLAYWQQGEKQNASELWAKFLEESADENLKAEIRKTMDAKPEAIEADLLMEELSSRTLRGADLITQSQTL
ncbi:MAG: tetratricopeptide repeat protein [Cyanobacteria bacterium]|nr:tetratricopeptide repeat protein [Cyanobacteriota bacterium]MDA1020054.1 tetratricopeptide repeat protein [Cyanobacteriota bacterium]